MKTQSRKWTVLICLLIFWIGLIAVQRFRARVEPPVQPASALHARIPQREGRPSLLRGHAKDGVQAPRLTLARVERVRPAYQPEVRNIFASIDTPEAVTPLPTPSPQAAIAPAPPDPFLEAAKGLRLLGYARAEGKSTAFLAYGTELVVAGESDVVAERFRVKAVREDTVLVTSLDGSREVTIGLSAAPSPAPPAPEPQKGKQP